MRSWLRAVLDLLLPPACARCGRGVETDAFVCPPCSVALPPWPPGRCAGCGDASAGAEGLCSACRDAKLPVETVLAASAYTDELATFVQRFKYPRAGLLGLDPAPAALLSHLVRELAREALSAGRTRPDVVVPVPLHPRRLRVRGFNPAWSLARALARELEVRADPGLLIRTRDTPTQTGLDRRARARNVAGAFRAATAARVPARVWLVDDVVTTGATLFEAARALRRAGATSVTGVCVARTPSER